MIIKVGREVLDGISGAGHVSVAVLSVWLVARTTSNNVGMAWVMARWVADDKY